LGNISRQISSYQGHVVASLSEDEGRCASNNWKGRRRGRRELGGQLRRIVGFSCFLLTSTTNDNDLLRRGGRERHEGRRLMWFGGRRKLRDQRERASFS